MRPLLTASLFALSFTPATLVAAAAEAQPAPSPSQAPAPSGPSATMDGYVEVNYSYNFNKPENGITNYRGFDNRHATFTLSNAVLGATFDYESLTGRLALQVGQTPSTYYLAEPALTGAGGAAPVGAELWKYIQEANAGWRAPVGRGLLLQGGIFLSTVGYEGMAVKDNWNLSRSNLFVGFPFYHTGFKATYDLTDRLTAMMMISNGWNSVVDNNEWKSITAQLTYEIPDRLTAAVLYFGGPERASGSPEGLPWRHTVDFWAQLDATDRLSFAVQADGGFEQTRFGPSYYGAAALYARVQAASFLYVAARGDVFAEHAAKDAAGEASHIFWPASLVASGTLTLDARPHKNLSFRLEYRHDHADGPMFFKGPVEGDGGATPYVPNADAQDTVTAGLTGWY